MTASNPTPDDLRTIAANLKAEGQTSRAEVLENVAGKLEKYVGLKPSIEELLEVIYKYDRWYSDWTWSVVRLYLSEFYEKLNSLETDNEHTS